MVEITIENWNNWSYISFKNAEAVLIVCKQDDLNIPGKMQLSKHKVILVNYKNTALKDRSKEELNLSGQSKQKKWSLWQLQVRELGKW